jgi:Ala-tRNA(Pro) deacylase
VAPNRPNGTTTSNQISVMPLSAAQLLDFLAANGIPATTVEHPPLATVAESQALRGQIAGGHTKNLFLKDKKGRHFLVSVEEHANVDLKTIHQLIGGSGRVSFGSADAMQSYLGVSPGAVTLLGAINDTENQVTVVIDEELIAHGTINAHPLVNTATTSIARDDLLRFLTLTGHEPLVLKIAG